MPYSYDRSAKSKGEETRGALNNAWIGLNNLTHELDPKGATQAFFPEARQKVQRMIDSITRSLFVVHVPEIKKLIADEVIGNLKESLNRADQGEKAGKPSEVKYAAEAVQYAVYLARQHLKDAVDQLAQNPDNDELKQRLASQLHFLLPHGNSTENVYQDALRLTDKLIDAEKGKKKEFFVGLKKGLEAGYEGLQELRSQAAFSYKFLPKVR